RPARDAATSCCSGSILAASIAVADLCPPAPCWRWLALAETRLPSIRRACWVYSLPRGGVIRVRGGTLGDTSWLRPTRHVWTRSKQPWVTVAEGDEIFEGQSSEYITFGHSP